jgi:hypothetical protein
MATGDYFWDYTVIKDYLLPFVLVFVIIFAILEKSKILGDGKRQINAIIALACGFILLASVKFVTFIRDIVPFFTVVLLILFIFLVLYGFVYGDTKGDPLDKNMKMIIGIFIILAVAIATVYYTGYWDRIVGWFDSENKYFINIVFGIIIIGALIAVLFGSGNKEKDKS